MNRKLHLLCLVASLAGGGAFAQQWREEQHRFGRRGHAVAFDADRGVHVVFGGDSFPENAGSMGTIEWNGTAWQRRQPAQSPPLRSGHAMVFDPVAHLVVVFGGMAQGALLGDTWTWDGVHWRQVAPPVAPSARSGHRMVWDSVRGQAVLFGGSDASGVQADTWLWSGGTWQPAQPAQSPPPRASHGMAFDPVRARALLQGGVDATGTGRDDTWEWDGATWQQVGAGFRRLAAHAMAFDWARAAVVLHGGVITGIQSDMWQWDPVAAAWSRVTAPGLASIGPRMQHAMDSGSGRLFLFGGTSSVSGGRYLLDVWEWDGTAWTLRDEERLPVRRIQAEMVYDPVRQRTVLFGGWGDTSGSLAGTFWNDTWEWDGASWTQATPAVRPAARSCAQSVWDSRAQHVLVFGGGGDNQALFSDTWAWNGQSWRLLHGGQGWTPRVTGAMAFDPARGRATLFGGRDTAGPNALTGTAEWDGTAWQAFQPAVEPLPRMDAAMAHDPRRGRTVLFGGWRFPLLYSDTWEWDGTSWTQVFPQHVPPPRRGHRMSYDSTHGRILMFGGDWLLAGTAQRDLWSFDGVDWTQLQFPQAPAAGRTWHAQAYDAARDRLLVLGGNGGQAAVQYGLDQWELASSHLSVASPETRIGSPLAFQVQGVPGSLFLLLLSGARAPGIPLIPNAFGPPRVLPLAPDRLLRVSLGFGLAGLLDATGSGGTQLLIPPDPSLAGLALFGAGILAPPGGAFDLTEDERMLLTR